MPSKGDKSGRMGSPADHDRKSHRIGCRQAGRFGRSSGKVRAGCGIQPSLVPVDGVLKRLVELTSGQCSALQWSGVGPTSATRLEEKK